MPDQYYCKIVDWLDGDTALIDVLVPVFEAVWTVPTHARIYGINTPEVHTKDANEKVRGLAAKEYAASIAPFAAVVTIRKPKAGWRDKFGRLLVTLTCESGKDFAAAMIEAKHALPWDGSGKKPI